MQPLYLLWPRLNGEAQHASHEGEASKCCDTQDEHRPLRNPLPLPPERARGLICYRTVKGNPAVSVDYLLNETVKQEKTSAIRYSKQASTSP
jgi:hypothetical protein